ncbi:MAG: hydrogenase small subunit [Candidatus Heimdallarchaeota archaeon]
MSQINNLGKSNSNEEKVNVVWLQGSGCTGCTISLLQTEDPDLVNAIEWFKLALIFHPTVMIPAGKEALKPLYEIKNDERVLNVLIVEGAVPEGHYCELGEDGGKPVFFEEWVKVLGEKASYVVAIGTCAAFGGIPSAKPNPTNCRSVKDVLQDKPVINIPGCPPHPDWIWLTLGSLLLGNEKWIELDDLGRPKIFFADYIHDICPRRQHFENLFLSDTHAEEKCLYKLGCKAALTKADCPIRLWNNGINFCISANAPCIGCTEPGFPDEPFAPFYERLISPEELVLRALSQSHEKIKVAGEGQKKA